MVEREQHDDLSEVVDDPSVWDVEADEIDPSAPAWQGAGPQSLEDAASQRNSALYGVQGAHDIGSAFATGSGQARRRARIMGLLWLLPIVVFVVLIVVN